MQSRSLGHILKKKFFTQNLPPAPLFFICGYLSYMKIIITESQYIKLLESDDKYNVVEQILEMEGIKYDGFEYNGRNRDSFGRTHDSVVFYFEFPNDYKHRSIRFLTKNNKVVRVSSASDFRTIADGFRYIPTNILNGYFIEKAKTYLEKTLSDRHPKDNLKESIEGSNVVEKILEMAEIKYQGCGFGGRTYDNFGRKVDTVEMYFKFPNESKLRSRNIHFITRNNKVVTVESSSDFRTLYYGFNYIPEINLMEYFIEKAKTYLEKILRYEYPNDNLKESVIKEDNLKTTLLHRIETEGWEDTSELVGGYENLIGIVGEDKIIDLLLSCFSDLNVQKRGNDIFLFDWQLPILEKPSSFWGLPLKVFNDNIEVRLEVKFGSDITKAYRNVRREFIRELVSRFPDLYTSDVNVYKDSGLYVKYDSFSLS